MGDMARLRVRIIQQQWPQLQCSYQDLSDWAQAHVDKTVMRANAPRRSLVASQTIPAEAVEAAAKWLHDNNCRSALHSGFPADFECYDWMDEAKELLEAAAPYMLAGAWSEGAQSGFDSTAEGFNGQCAFDHCAPDDYPPTNPYSGDKWEVADWRPAP